MNATVEWRWVKYAGVWRPMPFKSAVPQQDAIDVSLIEAVDEPVWRLEALKLAPHDFLLLTTHDTDYPPDVARNIERMLADRALGSVTVLFRQAGERIETLNDDQLAAIGLQRIGSWRDRPLL